MARIDGRKHQVQGTRRPGEGGAWTEAQRGVQGPRSTRRTLRLAVDVLGSKGSVLRRGQVAPDLGFENLLDVLGVGVAGKG